MGIARSTAINRSRLTKIKARQDMLSKIAADTKLELQKELQNQGKLTAFTTKLITQGLLMLLEDHVAIRCRQCDDSLVQGCLDEAAAAYKKAVAEASGMQKTVKLSIDKDNRLPPASGQAGQSCLGGIVLACQ